MAMQRLDSGSLAVISAGAGTTTVSVGVIPGKEVTATWTVERVGLFSVSTVTGNGNATGTLRYVRDGVDKGAIATLLFASGVNVTALTEKEIPRSALPSLIPGDVLVFDWVQTGAGLALPVGARVVAEIGG